MLLCNIFVNNERKSKYFCILGKPPVKDRCFLIKNKLKANRFCPSRRRFDSGAGGAGQPWGSRAPAAHKIRRGSVPDRPAYKRLPRRASQIRLRKGIADAGGHGKQLPYGHGAPRSDRGNLPVQSLIQIAVTKMLPGDRHVACGSSR